MIVATNLNLAPKVRMLGAIPLLPLMLRIFFFGGGGRRGEKHANIACLVLNYRIKIGFIFSCLWYNLR